MGAFGLPPPYLAWEIQENIMEDRAEVSLSESMERSAAETRAETRGAELVCANRDANETSEKDSRRGDFNAAVLPRSNFRSPPINGLSQPPLPLFLDHVT